MVMHVAMVEGGQGVWGAFCADTDDGGGLGSQEPCVFGQRGGGVS